MRLFALGSVYDEVTEKHKPRANAHMVSEPIIGFMRHKLKLNHDMKGIGRKLAVQQYSSTAVYC